MSGIGVAMQVDVILIRHAIAFERDTTRWPEDERRPLTAEGGKRFEVLQLLRALA